MKVSIYMTSEGVLNWIEKMPEMKKIKVAGLLGWKESDDMYQYAHDIERAKAESIPFEDQEGMLQDIVMLKLNLTHVKRGEIYPIELDADIQKVYMRCEIRSTLPYDWTEVSHREYISATNGEYQYKVIARIAAPKKKEESEDELWVDLLCNKIGYPYDDMHPDELQRTINRHKEEFELKRTPL